MKKWFMLLAATANMSLYQNCSAKHEAPDGSLELGSETDYGDIDMAKSLVAFERSLYPITQESGLCYDCHGVGQQPLHSLQVAEQAHNVMIGFGLVNLREPSSSALVDKIRNGSHNNEAHNNIPPEVADRLEQAIADWRDELIANGGLYGVGDGIQPTFNSIFTNILGPKCITCHSEGHEAANIDYTDYVKTINTGGIVAGNAEASLLFTETLNQNEPQGTSLPLSAEEIDAVRDWINRGALNN